MKIRLVALVLVVFGIALMTALVKITHVSSHSLCIESKIVLLAADSLKPFCPPDRWDDADNDSTWDSIEFYDPLLTGYKVPDDIGLPLTLRLVNYTDSPSMGTYYTVRFSPTNTADPVCEGPYCYLYWIMQSEPYLVNLGDQLQLEICDVADPTVVGLEYVISLDPSAEWDSETGTVINSAFPVSPRIIKIPCFDPTLGVQIDSSGLNYTVVSKMIVVFLEQHSGADFVGRFMRTTTYLGSKDGDAVDNIIQSSEDPLPCPCYICGDVNGDGKVDISDAVYCILYLFKSGRQPHCGPYPYAFCSDATGDGEVTISDVVYLINYLLKGGDLPIC